MVFYGVHHAVIVSKHCLMAPHQATAWRFIQDLISCSASTEITFSANLEDQLLMAPANFFVPCCNWQRPAALALDARILAHLSLKLAAESERAAPQRKVKRRSNIKRANLDVTSALSLFRGPEVNPEWQLTFWSLLRVRVCCPGRIFSLLSHSPRSLDRSNLLPDEMGLQVSVLTGHEIFYNVSKFTSISIMKKSKNARN